MSNFKLPNVNDEKTILKTIRIKNITLKRLEKLANKSGLSLNRLINECIEYAINNMEENVIKNR